MIHLDWLSASQLHPQAPDWGKALVLDLDPETGEETRRYMKGDQRRASWDSSLHIRSYGGRVEVSGNPSKWGRLEAIVGVPTMTDALEVYNRVLAELGLPAFTAGSRVWLQEAQKWAWDGARVSRLDLTRNLVLGSPAALRAYLDWMSTQRFGRRGLPFRVVQEGQTVQAGKRDRRLMKFYDKGAELVQRAKDWRLRRCEEKDDAAFYLERCGNWAKSIGLLRAELQLGAKELSESSLNYVGAWSDELITRRYDELAMPMAMSDKSDESSRMGTYMNMSDDMKRSLMSAGATERNAMTMVNWVLGWMSGSDPCEGLSRRMFYYRAKFVRDVLGIDVRSKPNILTFGTRVRVREIEVRPLTLEDLPHWYQRPGIQQAA